MLASLDVYAQPVIEFVRSHEAWAGPIVFCLAFGESLAFLSLILPAWAALVGIGGLIGITGIDFWTIWSAGALGAALVANGNVEAVEYENVGGKGGILGLEHYAKQYASDANTMLMGGMVMVGAVALHKPAVNLSNVQPLARLTSDYMVLAVRDDSPIRNAKDLMERMQKDLPSVVVAGASAGSVDHMFIGRLVRAAPAQPADLKYLPFAGGAQVIDAVGRGATTIRR